MKTDEPTAEQIRRILEEHDTKRIDPNGYKPAAVLVPLFLKDGKWHVLLTRRSQKVEHHKGEISFPGGHVDEGDPDNRSAALREAEEEVGVPPDRVEVLGKLDDIETITDYRVRPFVGVIPFPFEFTPSDIEIDEIITLPLAEFVFPGNCTMTVYNRDDRKYPVYFFKVGGYTVWGATAKILKQFLQLAMDFKPPAC